MLRYVMLYKFAVLLLFPFLSSLLALKLITRTLKNMPSGTPTKTTTSTSDSSYSFHVWFHRLEQLLQEITTVGNGAKYDEIEERDARLLIARVLGHFEDYFDNNSRAAHLNVFALFAPTWYSSLECVFLWIAGFRPAVLLHLVSHTVEDLSPDQTRSLDRLKRETRVNEKAVEDELAKIQETAAAPPLMDVIREAAARPIEEHSFETRSEPVEQLRASLEAIVANADSLRVTTGAKVAEILNPYQCLRFLVAAIGLLKGLRASGMQRDNR